MSRTDRHNNLNLRSFAEDVEEEERLSGNVVRMDGVQVYGVVDNVSTRSSASYGIVCKHHKKKLDGLWKIRLGTTAAQDPCQSSDESSCATVEEPCGSLGSTCNVARRLSSPVWLRRESRACASRARSPSGSRGIPCWHLGLNCGPFGTQGEISRLDRKSNGFLKNRILMTKIWAARRARFL